MAFTWLLQKQMWIEFPLKLFFLSRHFGERVQPFLWHYEKFRSALATVTGIVQTTLNATQWTNRYCVYFLLHAELLLASLCPFYYPILNSRAEVHGIAHYHWYHILRFYQSNVFRDLYKMVVPTSLTVVIATLLRNRPFWWCLFNTLDLFLSELERLSTNG